MCWHHNLIIVSLLCILLIRRSSQLFCRSWRSSTWRRKRRTDRQGDPMVGPHVHMGPINYLIFLVSYLYFEINVRRRILLVSLCPLESNEVCIVGDYISQPPSHSQKNYNFSFEYNFEKCLSTCKGYWQYGAAKLRKVGSVKNIFLFLPNLFRLLFNSHILPSLLFLLCELQRIHNLQQNTATPQKCSLDGELPVLLLRVSGTSTMLKLQKRKKC